MIDSDSITWPRAIASIRDLMYVVRRGFEIVQFPRTPPAEPRYQIRWKGTVGPNTSVRHDVVMTCQRRGQIELDVDHPNPDGSVPIRLGSLSKCLNAPVEGS